MAKRKKAEETTETAAAGSAAGDVAGSAAAAAPARAIRGLWHGSCGETMFGEPIFGSADYVRIFCRKCSFEIRIANIIEEAADDAHEQPTS